MVTTSADTTRTKVRGGLVRSGLAAGPRFAVEIDVRTAYDFLSCADLELGELDDLLPEDRAWLVEGRRDQVAMLAGLGCSKECAGFVLMAGSMLLDHPEIRTARELVAAIDATSDPELTELMVRELLEEPEYAEPMRRALQGDDDAFEEVKARLEEVKGHSIISGSIRSLAPAVRGLVHFWLPRYEAIEARVGRMLERDAARLRREDSAGDPIAFVERATAGVRIVPQPRTRRIVLAPQYFGRPYNSLAGFGETMLIYYPIADTSLGSADRLTPPNSTVRLYRALADESRLRILKLLTERDRYLTEIANELALSKPTINHHLAALRAAGLVTAIEQGSMMFYSLRRDRADEAGIELRAFLAH